MASGILLPRGVRLPPRKVFRCACGMAYPVGDRDENSVRNEWGRHVANCEKVDEAIHRVEDKRQRSGFKRMLDREQFAFLRERALRRKEISE